MIHVLGSYETIHTSHLLPTPPSLYIAVPERGLVLSHGPCALSISSRSCPILHKLRAGVSCVRLRRLNDRLCPWTATRQQETSIPSPCRTWDSAPSLLGDAESVKRSTEVAEACRCYA